MKKIPSFKTVFQNILILFSFLGLGYLIMIHSISLANASELEYRDVILEFSEQIDQKGIVIINNKTIVTYWNNTKNKDSETIIKDIKTRLDSNDQFKNTEYYDFYPEWIKNNDKYFISTLSSFPKTQFTKEMIYPRLLVAAGEKDLNGKWNVYLEFYDFQYNSIILKLPNEIIDEESKQYYLIDQNPISVGNKIITTQEVFSIPGLPWTPATSWYLTGGVHSSNSCCLDFQDSSGGEGTVKAAEAGTKIYTNGTCIFYKNGSHSLIYQHIKPSDISSAPTNIHQGDYIGKTYTGTGCGLNFNVLHHVHFGTWNTNATAGISIIGTTLNNWLVNYNSQQDITSLTKNQNTVYVNGLVYYDSTNPCIPPASGDWSVNQNCEIDGSYTVPANLIIDNNSILTIKSTSNLNIDFINYHLLVKFGSKLFIENGGKIF